MFGTIILAMLAIIGLVGVAIFVRGNKQEHRYEFGTPRTWGASLLGASLIVGLVASYYTMTYSQDPGEARVLRSFTGEVIGSDTSEGLGFKAPWVNTVSYDVRNLTVEYLGNGDGANGPAITTQDKDGAPATMDLVVRYSLVPESVESTYVEFGEQTAFEEKLVFNDVRSVVRNIPLQYPTATFRLNREDAALKMQQALAKRWENKGIIVESVDLRDIRYPEGIEQSLQAVQEARNNASKASADLETAKFEAERTRIDAQAQADADQIIRCGAKTTVSQEEINGVMTEVTKTVPLEGARCQDRLNEQVLLSKYIDMLGKRTGDTMFVLPEDVNGLLQLQK